MSQEHHNPNAPAGARHAEAERPAEGIDITLPLSILIAGILVGGSVLYGARVVSEQLRTLPAAPAAVAQEGGSGAAKGDGATAPTPEAPSLPDRVEVATGVYPALGSADATVAVVEFTDLECSFCKRFRDETFPQIKTDYIDTGKVKFYKRHFPLSFHSNASKAGEAIACANEQGKFWEMIDAIYADQGNIGVDALKAKAQKLALNTSSFNSCLDEGKMKEQVTKDLSEGSAAGVSGTPTFFINGKRLVGAVPYDMFKTIIDAELKA